MYIYIYVHIYVYTCEYIRRTLYSVRAAVLAYEAGKDATFTRASEFIVPDVDQTGLAG